MGHHSKGVESDIRHESAVPPVQRDPWVRLDKFIDSNLKDAERAYGEIATLLRPFNPNISSVELPQVLVDIREAKELLDAAVQWKNPYMGCASYDDSSRQDRVRGEQWRMAQGYAALERLLQALLPKKPEGIAGVRRGDFQIVLDILLLEETTQPLKPPKESVGELVLWFSNTIKNTDPIYRFLHLQEEFEPIFRSWLIKKEPMRKWLHILVMAKILREVTVRGHLSAEKALHLGLRYSLRSAFVHTTFMFKEISSFLLS